MSVKYTLLVIAVGTIAGFLNTVAGGGSLFTMPVLIFLGLPSAVANGTNRIAIMIQNIIAITNFKNKGYFDWKLSVTLALPAVLGAIVGSNIAISLPDDIFNKILAVVMIIILGLILWNPKKRLKSRDLELNNRRKIIGAIVFFFVGIYGGLIQAGVGFIIIASLTLITGFSLVRINSMKVLIVAIYMIISLLIFIINGKVNWLYGLSLAIGNGLGAFIGSNLSVKKGDKWIKVILTISILLMSAKLLGIFRL
ncbi:sulfite exporter TauE/SafE family protein [Thermohalobacter berrensis]|uniref:Probable membrane transporter protein n=1 Tax=Thermohalobacter berrensis TaxID=99594 RepID=A0A419T7Q5_9FIRM|nr:sulfite exporter TauE/SafE family protein [Thermohalobacter berrensis]RKD33453.1 integrase [Thermohalobacter berrensis]